jgi:hypothetical protein
MVALAIRFVSSPVTRTLQDLGTFSGSRPSRLDQIGGCPPSRRAALSMIDAM